MDAKKWYKSKLLWYGTGQAVAGAGKYAMDGDPTDLIAVLSGLVTIALRILTKQPVGL